MKRNILIAALAAAALSLSGCAEDEAANNKTKQSERAAAAAASIDFSANAEIDNIKNRLQLTSNPGAIGFVVLLNEAGQPILYTSVKGKITSSGKRLTPPVKFWSTYEAGLVAEAPSDEGTWGSSDPYIYFWDVNGVYHQWSGRYLYSDKPIRLRVEPLVISDGVPG